MKKKRRRQEKRAKEGGDREITYDEMRGSHGAWFKKRESKKEERKLIRSMKKTKQVDCSLREQMVGTGGWTKKEQEVVS